VFVLLDDFQFSVQSYHQRNRLFVNAGQADWFTVPVVKSLSFKTPLNQTRIDEASPWRKKMLRRLRQNYARTPYFEEIFPAVEAWIEAPATSLAEQNIAFIRLVLERLGWERQLRFSSEHPSEATRSQRVLDILRRHGATRYYVARGSFEYMLEDGMFPVADIELRFQNFVPKAYRQHGSPGEFVPYLSVLDALFNAGPAETARLITQGTDCWLDWNDMLELVRNPT
jgi:hypothetical protein